MRAPVLALTLLVVATATAADDDALRKRALKLNDVTGEKAIDAEVKALAASPAETKKLLAAAARMAKEEKDQPFTINASQVLALTAYRLKDVEHGKVFFDLNIKQAKALGSGKKIVQAYAGSVALLATSKKYDDAEKVCKEFLELESDDEEVEAAKPGMLNRMIVIIARKGDTERALGIVDRRMKANPDNFLLLDLKGQVLMEAGQIDKAAKAYEEMLEKASTDKRLTEKEQKDISNEVRYLLSGVYVDLKNIDKATEMLQTLLKDKPDSPSFNNDLGFIWADNDRNLDEAEKLIRKALDEDKKQRIKANPELEKDFKANPGYVDSLGWVLFKKKQYKEAKKYLQEAVEHEDGQHAEIYDHLADAHMALGEKAEAVAAWKKALEVVTDSRRDKERKTTIEKKLAMQEK
jgi:tetratricopeptide (TPR) repeat protein